MESAATFPLVEFIKNFWIVPAGVVALYYYGWFHFNTPDYALDQRDQNGVPLAQQARLLMLAPPIFTTSRLRFNRYALRYILILETTFLAFVLLPDLFVDIARAGSLSLQFPESTEGLQYRAIWALFALTGLLSSFPLFKDIDTWLLSKLHQAALIPDDARLFAEMLEDAEFVPSALIAATVRSNLTKRDTKRIAERKAEGTLELKLLKTLWLRAQLQQVVGQPRYRRFKLKLERDLQDVECIAANLKPLLLAYFSAQEKIIPDNVPNIDDYIFENLNKDGMSALDEQRRDLLAKCDCLFQRLCLMTALLIYASESAPERVGESLRTLGFQIDVMATPSWDWDSVVKVVGGLFIVILTFNVLFALGVQFFGYADQPGLAPDRGKIIFFSVIGTALYGYVLLLSIRLKRRWRRQDDCDRSRPENLLIALYGYLGTALIFAATQFLFRGYVNWAPFLFALNQGIAGYFVGIYIDRSMAAKRRCWTLPTMQAVLQFAATLFASLSSSRPDVVLTLAESIVMGLWFAAQSAMAGFVLGMLFQFLYRRTEMPAGTDAANVKLCGDLAVQTRLRAG